LAHESSGLRSFPSTPAPAIWVVGVTSDRDEGLDGSDPQALQAIASAAIIDAGATHLRTPPFSTRSTLTFGQLAEANPTSARQLRQFVGPGPPRA